MSKTPFYGQPGPSSIFCASSTAHFYRPLPVANTITVEINFITAHANFAATRLNHIVDRCCPKFL